MSSPLQKLCTHQQSILPLSIASPSQGTYYLYICLLGTFHTNATIYHVFLKTFIALVLTFRSKIHFEFICFYGVRWGIKFILLPCTYSAVSNYLKRLFLFFPCNLRILVKNQVTINVRIFLGSQLYSMWVLHISRAPLHFINSSIGLSRSSQKAAGITMTRILQTTMPTIPIWTILSFAMH